MEPLYLCKMPSPIGELTLAAAENALTRIVLPACLPPGKGIYAQTPLLQQAMEQLCAYFAGELREFSLPLAPKGTPFEQRVWKALCAIPYGETRTYGQIAAAAGSPRGLITRVISRPMITAIAIDSSISIFSPSLPHTLKQSYYKAPLL